MKKVTWFVMTGCPYCRQSLKALEELKKSNDAYRDVVVEQINETVEPEIADKYDYYYVPSMFIGDEKLYESHPGETYDECKANVKKVLDAAIAD